MIGQFLCAITIEKNGIYVKFEVATSEVNEIPLMKMIRRLMKPENFITDNLSNKKERVHLLEAWKAGKLETVPNLYSQYFLGSFISKHSHSK